MASEIVLVNITGVDKAGLMAMVTSTLAEYQVTVLDVGQAIIHDTLALGFLIQIPDSAHTAAVKQSLQAQLDAENVPVRFTAIDTGRYAEWVGAQGKPRYVLTLMAHGVAAEQLAMISTITRDHGLNIETIRRLTGRVPAARLPQNDERTCIEIILRGTPDNAAEAAVKAALMDAAVLLNFDFSVQRDTVYRRNRRLVAFDMDSTLINIEVIDELARLHGVGEQVSAITERAMRGELDFQQSFRARVALLKGLSAEALTTVANGMQLNDGAERLIRVLKRFGYKLAVLSGGFAPIGEHLRKALDLDYVHANELVTANGVFTGEVQGHIVDATRKARLLTEIASKEGIALEQTIAIGDGANDLPMLNVAGLGIAYHAKPLVKATADHAISNMGLDSLLYLMGFSDQDIEQALTATPER